MHVSSGTFTPAIEGDWGTALSGFTIQKPNVAMDAPDMLMSSYEVGSSTVDVLLRLVSCLANPSMVFHVSAVDRTFSRSSTVAFACAQRPGCLVTFATRWSN